MSAFGQGNNKGYLVHIITVKHHLEQKMSVEDVRKMYKKVLEIKE